MKFFYTVFISFFLFWGSFFAADCVKPEYLYPGNPDSEERMVVAQLMRDGHNVKPAHFHEHHVRRSDSPYPKDIDLSNHVEVEKQEPVKLHISLKDRKDSMGSSLSSSTSLSTIVLETPSCVGTPVSHIERIEE